MNIREMLGIVAAVSVVGLAITIPFLIKTVPPGETTPGKIDKCIGGHDKDKATKLFRITIDKVATLGEDDSFNIKEYSLILMKHPKII